MLEQDTHEFAMLLIGIGEAFDKVLSQTTVDFYWNVLRNFSFAEVQRAIYLHFANPDTGKYFPLPADIIAGINGSSKEQALLAWTKTTTAMQTFGIYSSIAFDDPLIHVVLDDMGGWQKLCTTKVDHLPFVGKEFQERYRGYVVRKPSRYSKYLVGLVESQNRASNYSYAPPVLFGDAARAQRVLVTGSNMPSLGYSQLQKNYTQLDGTNVLPEEQSI